MLCSVDVHNIFILNGLPHYALSTGLDGLILESMRGREKKVV